MGLRLRGIEFTRLTRLVADLGDTQALFLQLDVFVGYGEFTLNSADIDIGICHIADEGDERIVVSRHGREVIRLLRLDLAAVFSPEIDFPRGRKESLIGE